MSDEEFLEELEKELRKSREMTESASVVLANEQAGPGIQDERELEGTDNAVKKCKTYDVVAHCAEEKIDCEMKEPPLEKPLAGKLNESFNNKEFDEYMQLCDKLGLKTMEDVDNFSKSHGNVKDQALLQALRDEANKNDDVDFFNEDFEDVDLDEAITDDPEAVAEISDLIKDEVEAIDGYKDAKEVIDDPETQEVIDHIEAEEVEHIDELADTINEVPEEVELTDEVVDENEPVSSEEVELDEPTEEVEVDSEENK